MYKSVTILNSNEHRDFRFTPEKDFFFAKDMNVIPITFSEIRKLCCDYPIVYLGGESPSLAILVGIDKDGKNLAIDENGKFRGDYIPAFLRRYPFIMVKTSEEQMALGCDIESGCFSSPEGQRIFDDEGKPTEILNNIGNFLKGLEDEFLITRNLVAELDRLGILEDRVLSIGEGDSAKKIGGFKTVEHEKMTALSDDILVDIVKKGWIEVITLQQFSLKNIDKLIALENAG